MFTHSYGIVYVRVWLALLLYVTALLLYVTALLHFPCQALLLYLTALLRDLEMYEVGKLEDSCDLRRSLGWRLPYVPDQPPRRRYYQLMNYLMQLCM